MKSETVHASVGQIKDIIATLTQAVPNGMTHSDAQKISGNKTNFISDIHAVFAKYTTASGLTMILLDWQNFYREVFGVEVDISKIQVPAKPEGFDRLLVVAKGMTPNRLFEKCKELFRAWRYQENLNTVISDRKTDHDYAIWVRDRIEADQELVNKSANDLKSTGISTITLEERLICELKFFNETGKHLDIQNITLCSGSRVAGGGVPGVFWGGGRLGVDWAHPDVRGAGLRARAVVSV